MTYKSILKSIFAVCLIVLFCSFYLRKEEKLKISKQNLVGAFGGDEETENAYFAIHIDSIYYPDPNTWERYELKGDTIITKNSENFIEKLLILKLTTDSLVLFDLGYEFEIHLNRRKNNE